MLTIAALLFLIMDPFGNLPVVNSLLADYSAWQKARILFREGAIAAVILVAVAFFGRELIETLALEEHSIFLAGGIVLFIIALGMLFPSHNVLEEEVGESPLIVPIAMPLIAGPSAISMVILFAESRPAPEVYGAIVLAAATSTIVLTLSTTIFSFLGQRGTAALARLVGMLLIMISVQMILDGVTAYIESLSR